jgi:hypothetical protein
MTMVPSLFLSVRVSVLVNASLSAALSGEGRMTLSPARKRAIGPSPVSEWILLLYSSSAHACAGGINHEHFLLFALS